MDAARKEWNKDIFGKIKVPTDDSANKTRLSLLYSSLYFAHLIPSERTGENPFWDSDEPSWDDFYTMCECFKASSASRDLKVLGDLFRNTVSLWHLIIPSYYESMIRAVIDIWRYEKCSYLASIRHFS